MTNVAYKAGKMVGRHPWVWFFGIAFVLSALVVSARIKSADENRLIAEQKAENQHKRDQEVVAREKAHEALIAKCTTGISDLVNAAKAAMKNGYPAQASVLMKPCDGLMTDAPAKLIYVRAKEAESARLEKLQATLIRQEKAKKKSEGVSLGMSAQDALDSSWGRPEKVNRTTNSSGVREQWVYGSGSYLYFTNGVLTSIQN